MNFKNLWILLQLHYNTTYHGRLENRYFTKKNEPGLSLQFLGSPDIGWCGASSKKMLCGADLEDRCYTGKKICQIWAEWAVCASWHLQIGSTKHFSVTCPIFYNVSTIQKVVRELIHFFHKGPWLEGKNSPWPNTCCNDYCSQ